MDVASMKTWIVEAGEQMQKNKAHLSNLDQEIGDGDHGENMARGFQEVISLLSEKDYNRCGDLLHDVAMTLISKVGGASGPLFGTAFMKMAGVAGDKDKLTKSDWKDVLAAAATGLKMRGKAEVGEKTMIDVWQPVSDYVHEYGSAFSWEELGSLSREKMEATKEMEATKGRAAYLGKRSVGHLDPGSVSSYYILAALAEEGCKYE